MRAPTGRGVRSSARELTLACDSSYGHLLKRIGAIVVSAASIASTTSGLDTLGAASHIVSDPHAGFAPVPTAPAAIVAAYADVTYTSAWSNPGNLFDS